MKEEINYSLGLDIGITSVGWAVINMDKKRIEDLGVRIFNAAENPQDGSSLALPRRTARGRRRLLRRKVYRINRVKKLIAEIGLLNEEELSNLYIKKGTMDLWETRIKGLDEALDREPWSKLLIYYCKHRGFKSNRKNEAKEKEAGAIINSINENKEKMDEYNARTVGELIYIDAFKNGDNYASLRNKAGNYNKCVSREMIREEIHTLFEKQRKLGNLYASNEIEDEYLKIFNSQRPYAKFEDMEKMVGYCTFEKKPYKRAPKNSLTAEEFILHDNMNKLSIIRGGEKRILTKEERKKVVKEAFEKKEIKYTVLRKLLALKDDERFSSLTYSINIPFDKTENAKFVSMKGYHEIRKSVQYGISKEYWNDIKDNRKLLDDISYVLTLGKNDEDIRKHMELRNIPDEVIEACIDISFSKFNNLSLKALNNILPFMKEGYQYNEACEKAGYNFKAVYEGEKNYKLPVISIDEIVNPVVNRALAQTRKVINAVIDKYGSPVVINIELARELKKNFKDRKAIEKEQKENREINDKIKEDLRILMEKEPTSSEVLKYKLWQQQRGECAYTGQRISIETLFQAGSCEIDHIIPFSRSFDNSLNNKVLVLCTENQRKGNRIPYEYFGEDADRWHSFEVWVNSSNLPYKKKTNLLKKRFSLEEQREWKERNLQDTKYICRYISNFINGRLEFKEGKGKKKVFTINGRATAYLRAKWGLTKIREEGDKHHALDAAVVAVSTESMQQEIARYSKADELRYIREGDNFIDRETGEIVELQEYRYLLKDRLPRPWREFSEELKLRLSDNPVEELKKCPISSYDEKFIKKSVRPIFVSRVPYRSIGGRLFKETVYSNKAFIENTLITKKKLTELTFKDIDNIYNYSTDKKLYDAISERLKEFNGDGKKAFVEEFRKPTKSGKLGPVVRSIKIVGKASFKKDDAVNINGGKVAKDGIVRIDIYEKEGKYYSVPVYRYQLAKGVIPMKAAVAHKNENEWINIDNNYVFMFSIFKNDLIKISYNKKNGYFGYFDSFDRSTALFQIKSHDNLNIYRGVGIKSDIKKFVKYDVDVLGNYHEKKSGVR